MEQKKRWVQHISGQGEKWEVDSSRTYEDDTDYCVRAKLQNTRSKLHWLPKSEYRLCDPPEVWRDVTEECTTWLTKNDPELLCHGNTRVHALSGYRLRKVQLSKLIKDSFSHQRWVFIVEQKVTQ